MKDNEEIKELMILANENPELEIMFMVDCDVNCCDDYAWNPGVFGASPEIQEFWVDDELIVRGEKEIKEQLDSEYEGEEGYSEMTEEEFNKKIDRTYTAMKESGEIKDAIFVYIVSP